MSSVELREPYLSKFNNQISLARGMPNNQTASFRDRWYRMLLKEQNEDDLIDAHGTELSVMAYDQTNPYMQTLEKRITLLPKDIQEQIIKDARKAVEELVTIGKEVDRIISARSL